MTVQLNPTMDLTKLRKGARVRVKISQWQMRKDNLLTREWEGVIKAIALWKPGQQRKDGSAGRIGTIRSILVEGTPSTRESQHCHRCGLTIENFVSIMVGYGPICSDNLGIPRPDKLDPSMIEAIRERIRRDYQRDIWVNVEYSEIDVLAPPEVDDVPLVRPDWDVRFYIEGNEILCATFPEFRDRAKSVSGWKWDAKDKVWRYPASPTIAGQLRDAFDGMRRRGSPAFVALIEQINHREQVQAVKEADDLAPLPNMETEGWLHQRRAYHFGEQLPALGLFMDMGTGKTLVALSLIVNRGLTHTLVIAPKKTVASDHTWLRNTMIHCPGKLAVIESPGSGRLPKRIEHIERAMTTARHHDRPVVVVINYEALDYEVVVEWLLAQPWQCVILDESHKIKATDGRRARACWKLGAKVQQRMCLTGTPMPHSPMDIWSQYRFLDAGLFGTSVVRFRQRYALMGGYGNKEVLGWREQDEMNKKIYEIAFRVDADVLDLPPERHEDVPVMLGARAMDLSKSIRDDMYAMLEEAADDEGESKGATIANVLTQILRQQQITSGFLPDDEKNIHRIDTAKEEALCGILESLQPPDLNVPGSQGEPVVVFCRFRHDLDVIRHAAEQCGFRYAEVSGRQDDLEEWKAGSAEVLGVQIQAGGAGIDLTRARYAVYYSIGYSLGDYLQSVKRVHRPGQTRATTYYHLVAQDTIDVDVYAALQQRKDVVASIMDRHLPKRVTEDVQSLIDEAATEVQDVGREWRLER